MKKGKFIVIEGGSGCGKTTQIEILKSKLQKGWRYYREPGSTKFGERVRDAVQGLHDYTVNEYAALFGYSAARANLIRKVIAPKLKKGVNIILDRYWYSTYAYQGTVIPKKEIEKISRIATGNLKPDLIIFYDVDPKIAIRRKAKKEDADRYDLKKLEFHKKVRRNYKELSRKLKRMWVSIDASKDIEEVSKKTFRAFKKFKIV